MYAVLLVFDNEGFLKEYVKGDVTGAYAAIEEEMGKHGFEQRQIGFYVNPNKSDPTKCAAAVQALDQKFIWFKFLIRDAKMINIAEIDDLKHWISSKEV